MMVLNDNDLLLVVDVQNDFCPGGTLAVNEGDRIIPVVNALIGRFAHVVLTQDWHPAGHFSFASAHPGKTFLDEIDAPYGRQVLWPDHCVQGTKGAAFHEGLNTQRAELVVRKGFHTGIDSYSAFFENDRKTPTGLGGYLKERGFERIFVTGLATDYCVKFSVIDGARRLGLKVAVIEDACRGITPATTADAIKEMEKSGAQTLDSRDIIAR